MEPEIFIGGGAFYAAVAFLAGTLVANLGWNVLAVLCVALFGGFAWLAIKNLFRRAYIVFVLGYVFAFVFGVFYYHLYVTWQVALPELPIGKSISFTAVVVDEPDQTAKFDILTVEPFAPYSASTTSLSPVARLRDVDVFASPGSPYRYGDKLKIAGSVEAPKDPGDSPAVFPKSIKFIAAHKAFWLREDIIDFKLAILAKFNEALPPEQAALLGGELLGGTDGMGADLKNEMAASETSYVVSMYGYKIAMLVLVLEGMLQEWLERRWRFWAIILAVVMFVMMTGGNVSVIRGAIMAIMAIVATHLGRWYDARNALTLTAALMAFFDPTLVAQAAFQLSFLSIAGILYLSRPLKQLFFPLFFSQARGPSESNGVFGEGSILDWREAVVVATASLLPIIPIIATSFGDFSLSAFPSNFLIFFAVLPVMVLGLALALVGFVSSWASFVIAKFASIFLLYQLAVIKLFAVIIVPSPLPFASSIIFVGYYAILALLVYRYS